MIRVNVFIEITESSHAKPLKEKLVELMELSLHDGGCINYDVFTSLAFDDRLFINETWKDRASLDAHMQTEHFKRIVPELERLGTLTMEEFNF